MRKLLYYFIWMSIYLGLCYVCDITFKDQFTGTFWETVIRALTFLIAVTFISISEKKGWSSWSKLIRIFKRKK